MATTLVIALLKLMLRADHARSQELRIGIIDFYGLHQVSESQARKALTVSEGDVITRVGDEPPAVVTESERRLRTLPGVLNARVNVVCCDAGRAILYVGIEEKGTHALRFRSPPRGPVDLPSDVVQAAEAFFKAAMQAVQRGEASEDHSQGHSLMHDSAARAIQERFIFYAARDLSRLREALRQSANDQQRAVAAMVLGYAADKRTVIGDLVYGVRDPSEEVRNNAMRALWVIAGFASRSPALKLRVPSAPFVDLLNSPVWSDRNKASAALMELSTGRDPELMASLRKRAHGSLIEMARWKSEGHAFAAFWLLGRVSGMSEDAIQAAWSRGDRGAVIEAALKQR